MKPVRYEDIVTTDIYEPVPLTAAQVMRLPAPSNPQKLVWSEAMMDTVVDCFRQGGTLKLASRMAGVDYRTLQAYLALGERAFLLMETENPPPMETRVTKAMTLFMRVEKAKAEKTAEMIRRADRATQEDPSKAFIWLERREPEEWGKQDKIHHTVKSVLNMSDDDLKRELAAALGSELPALPEGEGE